MGSVMMAMDKMMGVLRYLNVFFFVFFVGRFVHQNVYKGGIGLTFVKRVFFAEVALGENHSRRER